MEKGQISVPDATPHLAGQAMSPGHVPSAEVWSFRVHAAKVGLESTKEGYSSLHT
jgi:hypothetical protein